MKFFVATVIAAATGATATVLDVAASAKLVIGNTATETTKTPATTPTLDTSSVAPNGNASVIYETVDVYTTYCPEATMITHGSKVYTVTEPTTLVITDCPCTITRPILTTSSVVCKDDCSSSSTPTETETPFYPTNSKSKTTLPTGTGVVTTTGSKTTSQPPVPTAAAGKVVPALAGMVGLMAALL